MSSIVFPSRSTATAMMGLPEDDDISDAGSDRWGAQLTVPGQEAVFTKYSAPTEPENHDPVVIVRGETLERSPDQIVKDAFMNEVINDERYANWQLSHLAHIDDGAEYTVVAWMPD